VRQQVRAWRVAFVIRKRHFSSSLHRSSERDQELLRHCILLRTAEESAKVKAHVFEEFQTVNDLEIQGIQKELEELEEEVQDRGVALANKDNIIDNLQAEIHELQQHQASAPATPAEDADPTSDIDGS
jgi:Skp family chaperone for outer membrane proteins